MKQSATTEEQWNSALEHMGPLQTLKKGFDNTPQGVS